MKTKFKKILCPVDFDPNSAAALDFAARLAREYHGALYLLHVVKLPFEPSEQPVEAFLPEWQRDARVRLEKFAAKHLSDGVKYQASLKRGDPASAILEAARELRPDLIVVATHGRTGLGHAFLGSVAERVVRESSVPVLTVRKHGPPAASARSSGAANS